MDYAYHIWSLRQFRNWNQLQLLMRLFFRLFIASVMTLFIHNVNAQVNEVGIGRFFSAHETFTFDTKSFYETAKKFPNDFFKYNFHLSDKYNWELELHHSQIYSDNYILTEGGKVYQKDEIQNLPIVLKGLGASSNDIRPIITINDGYLYGKIKTRLGNIYFEPLRTFDKSAAVDEYIVYHEDDVIHFEGNFCAAKEHDKKKQEITFENLTDNSSNFRDGQCLTVEYALANDSYVYASRGNNVANWNAGIVADLNSDYDDSFADEIRFVIVETYISQNTSQDEWGNTNDLLQLLNNFRDWNVAPATGFNNNHDLAGIWSDNSYTGSTIGWASVGAVCTSFRHHSLRDWGGSASQYRNLVSHEIGHNFNLSHLGESGYIMSPSVSGTTSWHPSSVSAIRTYYDGLSCLSTCSGGPPPPPGNAPVSDFSANFLSQCNPTQLQMVDLSTNDPTSWSWQFENGTPGSSAQQNPVVNFPGGGTYRVTLTATNTHGSDTKILDMNVPVPSAPTSGYSHSISGNTVNFSNSSSDATSYNWTFGDGNGSTSTNPSHTYSSPGTYSVSLLATNDCGNDTETKSIVIVDNVTAAFIAATTSDCEGETIQFTNQSSSNATNYFWEFEGGSPSTSTAENPLITYNNSGTFNAKLTVSNASDSDIETKLNYISINDAPNVAYTYSEDGYTITFDNNTVGGTSYFWDFGDGNTSSSPNPTHTYALHGTYNVVLTSTNSCGSDVTTQNIILEEFVTAAFTSNIQSGCQGQIIEFVSTSNGGVTSYLWEFEGGTPSTSSDQNPTVVYNQVGNHNVKLTVSNSTSSDTEEINNYISIIGTPNTQFTYSKDGNTFEFDNNTIGGLTYFWDFGDGNTSTDPNPIHTYSSFGTFTVILTSTNTCGSEDANQNIVLEEFVTAAFSSDVQTGCEGQIVEYTSTSNAGVTNYLWEFENGTPSTSLDQNPIVVYSQSGNHDVNLTVSNATSSDTEEASNYVSITNAPNTQFTYSQDEYTFEFDNNTIGGLTYVWDFGDGNSSTDPNPNHTYTSPGTYDVNLSASNTCGEEEATLTVSIDEIVDASFESATTQACVGETIEFTNTSFGDIASYSWEFEGGSPSTSDQENPEVRYNSAGSFNVKLTVEGIYGTQDVVEIPNHITVSEYAEADFSYVLDGFTVTFNNLSSSYDDLSWNFGDDLFSSDENPIHTYTQEGNYTILLTVENECGSDEKEVTIPVFDQLLANFQASKTTICPGEAVQLQDLSSGNPTQWSWVIEGSTMLTAEEQNPMITLMDPGIYTVGLTVSNSEEENSKIENQYLEVMELPTADFAFVQEDLSFTFQNQSEDGLNYIWDFGDGNSSTLISPEHTYENEGDYIVTLEVFNECFSDVMEFELAVYERLLAGFSADNVQICAENTIQFTDRSTGNTSSWLWSFPGGNPSTSVEQNPTVTYMNPGSYDVSLQVNSETEEVTESQVGYVNVLEAPQVDILTSIEGYDVEFSSSLDSDLVEVLWDFGDGTTSSELKPIHTYEIEGIYEAKLIIENICGLYTVKQEIKVQTEIEIDVTAENLEICPGETISFIESTSKNVLTWDWTLIGATMETSQDKNPIVQYDEPGSYDVILSVTSLFDEKEILLENYVTVMDSPVASFQYEINRDSVQFFNLSEYGSTFEWVFGDEGSSQDSDPAFIFSEDKSYEISLITSNNCSSDTIKQVIDLNAESNAYANFSISENSYCLGDTIQFIDLSSEDITEWTWKFDGGLPAVSDEKNPKVLYSSFGTYNVELTVSNGFNKRTIMLEDYVTIIEKPVALFNLIQNNNEIELENMSEHVNKYLWDFGDGITSGGQNAVHTFKSNGDYLVNLKVENSCGVAEYEEEVSIIVYPKAGFSLDLTEGCSPLTVNFENRSTENSEDITWIFEGIANDAITEENPIVVYDNAGMYGIKVVASNSFGADTITIEEIIEVYESPIIEINYEIAGFVVDFEAAISNYDSLHWDFGDQSYSSDSNTIHTYISGGNFEVKLTAYLGDCITEEVLELSLGTTSVEDLDEFHLIKTYPNPTAGRFTIDFNTAYEVHSIQVLDQLGRRLYIQKVEQNITKADILLDSGIPAGNYVVLINVVDSTPILKKLVVAR